ncbi:MAG TPA: NRDE family protein [Gemmatimonadales bacterium]|nr:NRDE family protein [Gemmatimonadales bacterium]
MSWVPLPSGYALAMNRDERRNRAPGEPPSRRVLAGVPALTPRDREAGGSWLTVNAHGLTLALLNRYEDTPHDGGAGSVSRGLLVLQLAPAADAAAIAVALAEHDLKRYRPFTLVAVGPEPRAELFEWNGQQLSRAPGQGAGLLAASSGADQQGAVAARRAVFAAAAARHGGLTAELLAGLHRSHLPARGALSICMHREEAVTVSSALVTVSPSEVRLRQVEGSPCEGGPVSELSLPREGNPA